MSESTYEDIQQAMLVALEELKKMNKETDFAAGYACGVETTTLYLFKFAVSKLIEKKKSVFAELLKFIREVHYIGHKMNGFDGLCESMEEGYANLILLSLIAQIFREEKK